MTEQARFGDFLHAAHHALAPQPGGPSPARGDVEEVSRSLQRVVTILGHYLQDTAIAFTDVPCHMPAPGGPWGRARAQARQALTKAAGFLLRPGTGRPMWPPAPSVSPLARRLDEVTAALATGRDLLYTHFTPGPQGGRAPPISVGAGHHQRTGEPRTARRDRRTGPSDRSPQRQRCPRPRPWRAVAVGAPAGLGRGLRLVAGPRREA